MGFGACAARLAWRMHEAIGPEALIADDTGFLKDGDASACVARQYTGTADKVTNCQVGVSVHLATDHASAAIDWRLFLPASWDPASPQAASPQADPAKVTRRIRCGIPDQVGHVEKWQLASDMIDETLSWGIDILLVIADAGYGDAAAFRLGLEERDLPYAVGVSGRHTAHPADARPVQPVHAGTRRPPKTQYPEPARTVKDLVIAAGRTAARPVSWREGSRPGKGRSGFKRRYSRFVALRIRPAGRGVRKAVDDPGLPERWLLAEWPATEPEPVQFWLSKPALRHAAGHPGAAGQAPLAHRTRLPRDATGPGPGPLRGPHLSRLAPSRHPRLRRPRLVHPATTGPSPKRHGAGLSLDQVVGELQTFLATWVGACPTCHRDIPTPIRT
ncbi:hypothetical protein SAM23877_0566 [Streptomyces ambofaciens ATCC 23877]|uniref:Transposase IS701-like DDE domain-containing protein n=1 Tax=Streptomyces ambofaciens (strain ATCC 23877 / 3486 / DSM 40053 / JCM 4204 / NBRC 12836 / NRRL B-2516) TaxID=278992 RepID=A0A0K2AKK7_STRA7|nr:hypothetical protein SAM23877_0566 [Streptomyces ambofaciens ATCC 23877]